MYPSVRHRNRSESSTCIGDDYPLTLKASNITPLSPSFFRARPGLNPTEHTASLQHLKSSFITVPQFYAWQNMLSSLSNFFSQMHDYFFKGPSSRSKSSLKTPAVLVSLPRGRLLAGYVEFPERTGGTSIFSASLGPQ
jgi:hypothetical protein